MLPGRGLLVTVCAVFLVVGQNTNAYIGQGLPGYGNATLGENVGGQSTPKVRTTAIPR